MVPLKIAKFTVGFLAILALPFIVTFLLDVVALVDPALLLMVIVFFILLGALPFVLATLLLLSRVADVLFPLLFKELPNMESFAFFVIMILCFHDLVILLSALLLVLLVLLLVFGSLAQVILALELLLPAFLCVVVTTSFGVLPLTSLLIGLAVRGGRLKVELLDVVLAIRLVVMARVLGSLDAICISLCQLGMSVELSCKVTHVLLVVRATLRTG